MLIRLTALTAMLIAVASPAMRGESQVRSCADLSQDIALRLTKKNITRFTLTIVRPGDEAGRLVVGTCDGGDRRIVYEPKGSGNVASEVAPAKTPAARPETKPAAVSAPALVPAPATAAAPAPVASPAANTTTIAIKQIDAASAPRRMARAQVETLRKLAVEQGADDRDSLDDFAAHLKIRPLPEVTTGGGDFVVVEVDHLNPATVFMMITKDGAAIMAERSSWLIGVLPEQHAGLSDLCLLVQDFPEPGANYSDWTVEFNGARYVKKTREFKGKSCLDRVTRRIAR